MADDSPRPHQLLVVRTGDDPSAWAAAGFTVTDHDDGTGSAMQDRGSAARMSQSP